MMCLYGAQPVSFCGGDSEIKVVTPPCDDDGAVGVVEASVRQGIG